MKEKEHKFQNERSFPDSTFKRRPARRPKFGYLGISILFPLAYVFACPILMEEIRSDEPAACIVYFGFGVIVSGALIFGMLASFLSAWNFAIRFFIACGYGLMGVCLAFLGDWVCDTYVTMDHEAIYFIPISALGFCAPFWVSRAVWNLRIEFLKERAKPLISISSLLVLTAIVGLSIQCARFGVRQIDFFPIGAALVMASIFAGLSLIALLFFVLPGFQFRATEAMFAYGLFISVIIGIVFSLVFLAIQQFGPGPGAGELFCMNFMFWGAGLNFLFAVHGLRKMQASLSRGPIGRPTAESNERIDEMPFEDLFETGQPEHQPTKSPAEKKDLDRRD